MNEPAARSTVGASQRAGARLTGLGHQLSRVPIFEKALVANCAIVLLGAIAGTLATLQAVRHTDMPAAVLVTLFSTMAVTVSFVVNWLLLRAAFQPLTMLEDVVRQVRNGNFSVRPRPIAFPDPAVQQFAETLTQMLDSVQRYRTRVSNLSAAVLTAEEEERKRVARDLHDDTAQSLTAVLLQLKLLGSQLGTDEASEALSEAREQVVQTLEGVHRMSLNLRPPSLEEMGLIAAIESRIDDLRGLDGVRLQFRHPKSGGRLAPTKELVLYRVVQEALTNVLKHSGANQVLVELASRDGSTTVSVADNGVGFEPTDVGPGSGLGLFGMNERMAMVGGQLTISSTPGHGCEIRASVPVGD